MGFQGRRRELALLQTQLDVVVDGRRADRGVALLLRGRRRVGKSRLMSEFATASGLPTVYFQVARGVPPAQELQSFADAIAASTLPDATMARDTTPSSLTAALTLLANALPDDPAIVVIDELPWLLEAFAGGTGELQRVWDQRLSRKPVLLVLLGSDLAVMEQLTRSDQPFHARATEMALEPLNPSEVAALSGLTAMAALDAYLITGGLPLIAQEWSTGMTAVQFLESSLGSPTSALIVSGNRTLDGEFPEASLSRQVLSAIGGRGERTFSKIQSAGTAPLNAASLTRSLALLTDRGIVTADTPLSSRRADKDRRFRIADPSLGFWLAFVEPGLAEIDRGRPDLAMARVLAGYHWWRGRAIEPIVRDALARLLPDDAWPQVNAVGGWWPRSNNPEIDLVGAHRRGSDTTVAFVGTIKWREHKPLSASEIARLRADAEAVPGVTAGVQLVGVCPAGSTPDLPLSQTWDADDLLSAWV